MHDDGTVAREAAGELDVVRAADADHVPGSDVGNGINSVNSKIHASSSFQA